MLFTYVLRAIFRMYDYSFFSITVVFCLFPELVDTYFSVKSVSGLTDLGQKVLTAVFTNLLVI